jgi:hypothetical protein
MEIERKKKENEEYLDNYSIQKTEERIECLRSFRAQRRFQHMLRCQKSVRFAAMRFLVW